MLTADLFLVKATLQIFSLSALLSLKSPTLGNHLLHLFSFCPLFCLGQLGETLAWFEEIFKICSLSHSSYSTVVLQSYGKNCKSKGKKSQGTRWSLL